MKNQPKFKFVINHLCFLLSGFYSPLPCWSLNLHALHLGLSFNLSACSVTSSLGLIRPQKKQGPRKGLTWAGSPPSSRKPSQNRHESYEISNAQKWPRAFQSAEIPQNRKAGSLLTGSSPNSCHTATPLELD